MFLHSQHSQRSKKKKREKGKTNKHSELYIQRKEPEELSKKTREEKKKKQNLGDFSFSQILININKK